MPDEAREAYDRAIAEVLGRLMEPSIGWLRSAETGRVQTAAPCPWQGGQPCTVRSCLHLGACRLKCWCNGRPWVG